MQLLGQVEGALIAGHSHFECAWRVVVDDANPGSAFLVSNYKAVGAMRYLHMGSH